MKKSLGYILAVSVIISLSAAIPVFAVQETNVNNSTHGNTADGTATNTGTLKDRLSKLKTDLQINLTATEQDRLKSRCKAAQTVIGKHKTSFEAQVKVRTDAYGELIHHLDEIIPRLKAANIDTAKLEQEKTSLKTKIDAYNTNLADYKQAIADLGEVDCVTDPTGFKAALEAARASHRMLISDAMAIRKQVIETIKSTLQDIHMQLEAKTGTNTQNGGSN